MTGAQLRGQVPVGGATWTELRVSVCGCAGIEVDVDDRQLGLETRAALGHRVVAARIPVAARVFALGDEVFVLQGEEGPELGDRLALRRLLQPPDLVDRVDLEAVRPPGIGQHRIRRGRMVGDADRVGPLREQVHHGRATAAAHCARLRRLQQASFVRVGAHADEREVQRDASRAGGVGGLGRDGAMQPGRSMKLNFSGKAKYSVSSR